MIPSNSTTSAFGDVVISSRHLWATTAGYGALALVFMFALDFGSKSYRDRRLHKFGSPPPIVPYKAPLGWWTIAIAQCDMRHLILVGLDLALYSLFRFFRYTFFELVCGWLDAAPGRTVELRMFGTGLIFTDAPENIKDIMSTRVCVFDSKLI